VVEGEARSLHLEVGVGEGVDDEAVASIGVHA
jgi:hypothetical protein